MNGDGRNSPNVPSEKGARGVVGRGELSMDPVTAEVGVDGLGDSHQKEEKGVVPVFKQRMENVREGGNDLRVRADEVEVGRVVVWSGPTGGGRYAEDKTERSAGNGSGR